MSRILRLCLLFFAGLVFCAAADSAISQESKSAPKTKTESGEAGKSGTSKSDSSEDDLADANKTKKTNLLTSMFEGNVFGIVVVVLILLLSVFATFFIVEHAITITRGKMLPEHVMSDLEQHISRGEIFQAIDICRRKENYSLATEVVLAGLERYQGSEFGFAEYRTAVEEAGEDHTGRLYRKTEVLNVIGSISPMLGLTGTVIGMIEAFNTIASRDGMARPDELAGGIGQALITTLLGLVVAIPTMVAFSYFRNKIDSLVAEAGKRIERLMMPLGRKRKTSSSTSTPPTP